MKKEKLYITVKLPKISILVELKKEDLENRDTLIRFHNLLSASCLPFFFKEGEENNLFMVSRFRDVFERIRMHQCFMLGRGILLCDGDQTTKVSPKRNYGGEVYLKVFREQRSDALNNKENNTDIIFCKNINDFFYHLSTEIIKNIYGNEGLGKTYATGVKDAYMDLHNQMIKFSLGERNYSYTQDDEGIVIITFE